MNTKGYRYLLTKMTDEELEREEVYKKERYEEVKNLLKEAKKILDGYAQDLSLISNEKIKRTVSSPFVRSLMDINKVSV